MGGKMKLNLYIKILVVLTMISTFSMVDREVCAEDSHDFLVVKEMSVPHINSFEIRYGDESKIFVSKDVSVFLHEDGGRRGSIKELAAVGRIERARLYIKGATVVKIVVLEMAQ